MLATERATVSQLNHLARAHLRQRGEVASRSRTYLVADGRREIRLAVGDEVILRRNNTRLPVVVRNGMTGRVTRADRHGVTVRLDPEHSDNQSDVTLPASYVGEHVDYGYARTVDTAQGATVDHSLFAPTAATSAERAYVALSRGRQSNRVYATSDRGWLEAIGYPRGHTLASDQHPDFPDAIALPDNLNARRAALRAALTRRHDRDRRQRPDRTYSDHQHRHQRRDARLEEPGVQNAHHPDQRHGEHERAVGLGM
jgi:ATP-dependent exoDNAse (exonuclease V) alpha subunit